MLRKLLKYDFRSMWKQFSIVWPAALVLGLINRFTIPWNNEWNVEINGTWPVISMFLLFGVMFAMFVVSMVYVLSRFYKGLLGDEGYLMHTLPVKTWQLVASKLICAVFVTFMNVVVAGLAMLLMTPLSWSDLFMPGLWDAVLNGMSEHPEWLLNLVQFCLIMLAGLVCSVTQMYLAMAIGHLFSKHRILISVAAYFGINLLAGFATSVMPHIEALHHLNAAWGQSFVWASFAMLAIPAALFFAATSYILSKHLNLE